MSHNLRPSHAAFLTRAALVVFGVALATFVAGQSNRTLASHTVAIAGFEVTASGPTYTADPPTTSFTYTVEDVNAEHDLSHWVLAMCLDPLQVIDDSTTPGYEDARNNGDPTTDVHGIKWNSTGGTFTLTVEGIFKADTVTFALKASTDVFYGSIEGIACNPPGAATATPTLTPTSTPTPTETLVDEATASPTSAASSTATPLEPPTPTSTGGPPDATATATLVSKVEEETNAPPTSPTQGVQELVSAGMGFVASPTSRAALLATLVAGGAALALVGTRLVRRTRDRS